MQKEHLSSQELIGRVIMAILFAAIGLLIIIGFSQYRPMFSGVKDLLGRIVLILFLLVAALFVRKCKSIHRYWQLIFALFVLAFAISLDWWIASFLLNAFGDYATSPAGLALEKLKTGVIIALSIIALTRLSGSSLGSIYVQRGDLKRGLTIGLIAFAISVAGSIPMSMLMFAGESIRLAEVLNWAPWILIAVLSNATNEELLFRGLFLRKLEPFYGKLLSNVLIVIVFTALHLGVAYTKDQMIFLAVVVLLSLVWGTIMQKTDSVWGSILFHAGTDIPVFLSIFSTRF